MANIAVDEYRIRPGRVDEAPNLTELAIRSEGFWSYDSQFLQDCRDELVLTPEFIEDNLVFVIEEKGIVVGFYSLEGRANLEVELVHLFVEPEMIGRGCGTQLLRHAVETARKAGYNDMIIRSDPFSEAFYKSMGALRFGEAHSSVRRGRLLPVLRFTLTNESMKAIVEF